MSFANFPHGITSFGIPLLGGGGTLPLMGANGKVLFVDPANGSDSNAGTSPKNALDTVAAAYAKTESGRGDVVYLMSDGSATGTARDAAITWSNNNTHLVGLCAPTTVNQRARIAPPTSETDVDAYTPYITLSGSGCCFANFSIFQGNSEDGKSSIGVKVSGSRNYFANVSILNGAHENQGDEATTNLQVTGSENTFDDCYIGVDTVARGNNAISRNIQLGSNAADEATRNIFRRCFFPCFADDTEPCFIYVQGLTDIQRWNFFQNCVGINTGTATLDAAVKTPGSVTGKLFLKDCAFYGVTDITAADCSDVLLYGISAGLGVVDVGHFKGVDIA